MCDRKTERLGGVEVLPSSFSLTLCPPITSKLDTKWEKYIALSITGGDERWKLHHVSVRLLCCQSDIHSFTIQTLSTSYYCLPSTFYFIFLLDPVPLLSSCLLSSLPSCHFVYIWKASGALGSSSNSIVCVSPSLCVGPVEHRLICGITSTALKCIKLLPDPFFYDFNMGYLTYHSHKVQQTQGSMNLHAETRRPANVTEESWWCRRKMYA